MPLQPANTAAVDRHHPSRIARDSACNKKSPFALKQLYLDYVNGTPYSESVFVAELYKPALQQFTLRNNETEHTTPLQGGGEQETCSVSTDVLAPLRDRSTCPYYEVLNYDDNRYPSSLIEVRCSNCSKGSGCRDGFGGVHSGTICQFVSYYTKVLRMTSEVDPHSDDGTCLYIRSMQQLHVACTCAKLGEQNPA